MDKILKDVLRIKKKYMIIDVANGTIYGEYKSIDDVCKWLNENCSISVIHNNKIYALSHKEKILTVDVYFEYVKR